MSTQSLQQATATTRAILANISPDQLQGATPCASWDVSALIDHTIGSLSFFSAAVNGEPPGEQADAAAGDFVAAYDEAAAAAVSAFSADGALERTVTLPFGDMPGHAVMGLLTTDNFQHGWDLAKATGQSTDLNPDLAAGILEQCRASISDDFRGPEGAPFGAEQTAPDDAPVADQLAAFLGRQP